MMEQFQEAFRERKALLRALEDYQENLLGIQIESAILDKAIEGTEELVENQLARNVRAKQKIQEMTDLADEEKAKADRFFQMTLMLNKGILSRVARLAAAKLKEVKEATKLRKEDIEQKLSDKIDAFVKAHSSDAVKKVRQMEIDLVKGKRTLNENAEKINVLRSINRSRRHACQVANGMFQLSVVELATSMLQYQGLVNRWKNPNAHKVALRKRMRMLMDMRLSRLPSPVVPSVAGGNESNEMMPRIASSSKCQVRLDTDEDPNAMSSEPAVVDLSTQDNDNALNRNSLSRAMRLKRSAANTVQCVETENTKRSKTPKTATAHSVIAQTAKDETKENNAVASEKQASPHTSPFEVPAEQSHFSQKTRKAKVVAADAMSDEISPDHGNVITFDENNISTDDENDISTDDENDISPEDENEARTKDDDDGMLLDMDDDQISDWASIDPNEIDIGAQSPNSSFVDTFMGTDATENNGFEQTTRSPQAQAETNPPTDNDDFVFDFYADDLVGDNYF